MNDLFRETDLMMTRRQLFGRSALGLGTAAMAGLMGRDSLGADRKELLGRPLHGLLRGASAGAASCVDDHLIVVGGGVGGGGLALGR